ncbi:MAG: PLP-dependent aminotransferase family protein [Anaerolineae bacterium]|nr:MAG: PLP-dependent aminotransferase family protein [Anaerolineae bacterium]
MMLLLDRDNCVPLYLQIRNQLRDMILDGTLSEGSRLMPERKLAAALGVNRSTVVNAYRELAADGLVKARVGQGTTVCHPLSAEAPGSEAAPPPPLIWGEYLVPRPKEERDPVLRDLMVFLSRADIISFAAGVPAPELYPLDGFRQAMTHVLDTAGRTLLRPCPIEGYYPLRQTLARRMSRRGATVTAENILIITGSQQGLDLIARAFLRAGDEVVVEAPSYLGALQIFSAAGARLLPVPLDKEGMRLDILENILIRYRPKLIYTLPTFQNPSGRTMSPRRRLRLLELARRHRLPVVEDDPYGEFYSTDRPPSPLLALDQDGYVIYLSTFSKTLFPGLRLGWVAAPRPVVDRLGQIKQLADLHCSTLIQGAVCEFCQRGALDKHLDRVRNLYRQRRDAMLAALTEYGPTGLEWDEPQGGFNLWCWLPGGLKARRLMAEAARQNVVLVPGEIFYPDGGGQEEIRLNFSNPPIARIQEGIQRLSAAVNLLREERNGVEEWRDAEFATQPIV